MNLVVVAPGLLFPDGESILRTPPTTMRALVERSRVSRLSPVVGLPEAAWLGLAPGEVRMATGPLVVAGLGADPPPRSTHFAVALGSHADGEVSPIVDPPTADELRTILEVAKRLNTRELTFVAGFSLEHALVWEKLGDLGTTALDGPLPYLASRPEGDGETVLRRWIDDSIDALFEQEFNVRRIDAGRPPINALWPFAQGVRGPVPNLGLRRGTIARVESGSLRLAGLTRLAGYVHGDVRSTRCGVETPFNALASRVAGQAVAVVAFEPPRDEAERVDWFVRRLDSDFLAPIVDSIERLVFATNGLAFIYGRERSDAQSAPFDERALHEDRLAPVDLHDLVATVLRPDA